LLHLFVSENGLNYIQNGSKQLKHKTFLFKFWIPN